MSVGISAYGAYLPLRRLKRKVVAEAHAWLAPGLGARAKGERAMASWDEDALTMAVEAARDALSGDEAREAISYLVFASTTAPFADRLNSGIARAALTLRESVRCMDFGGSLRAGLSALQTGIETAKAGGGQTLVLASDRRRVRAASAQELDFGDGAAALVIADADLVAEHLGSAVESVDFVDHFRGAGEEFDYHWEERWVRDEGVSKVVPATVKRALKEAVVDPSAVDVFIMPSTLKGAPQAVAKACSIAATAVQDTLAEIVGDTGSGHALMMLARALEGAKEGKIIVVAQFGAGCEVHVLRTTAKAQTFRPHRGVDFLLAERREETNYMRFLVFNELIEWDKGMRAEKDNKTALTSLYRYNDAVLGLVGGRCAKTGAIQFPRTRMAVSGNGVSLDAQEPYKFAERAAQILTWSGDNLAYSPDPPNHYGMIAFEGGGRILMDIADVGPGEIASGDSVRMVFRIKDFDERRGFRRYFWKAAPMARRKGQAQ